MSSWTPGYRPTPAPSSSNAGRQRVDRQPQRLPQPRLEYTGGDTDLRVPEVGGGGAFLHPAQHGCEYIVPAMDCLICPTCGRDNLSDDTGTYIAGASQPDGKDPNVENISRRSRSFQNLA